MAIAVAQEVNAEDPNGSTSGTTITVTLTPSVHSVIHVFATCFGTVTTATCADTANGNYNHIYTVDDTTVGVRLFQFYFENVAGSATTITITFSGSITGKGVRAVEISGAKTSGSFDVYLPGNYQLTPGTGTDATTTLSATNVQAVGLIVAMTYDSAEGNTNSAGTGFTTGSSGWVFGSGSNLALTENKRITSSASQAATFTAVSNDGHLTIGTIYDELAPVINTQPQAQTAYVGQTATFTVSATTSGGSLSYQWTKNGSNVGTNSSSYTTGSLVTSDDASYISCSVTDSNNTTVTSSVALHVLQAPTAAWVKH